MALKDAIPFVTGHWEPSDFNGEPEWSSSEPVQPDWTITVCESEPCNDVVSAWPGKPMTEAERARLTSSSEYI